MDKKGIRYLAQCYDLDSGEVTEEILLSDEAISKANTLKAQSYGSCHQGPLYLSYISQ